MILHNIIILHGAVGSGKTSTLLHWLNKRDDVCGILSPLVSDERVFMTLPEKIIFRIQADAQDKEILSVGKYIFSAAAFDRAIKLIENNLKKDFQFCIIDEIGPLELNKQGFYSLICKMLRVNKSMYYIFVVRSALVESICSMFKIKNPIICSTENFENLIPSKN